MSAAITGIGKALPRRSASQAQAWDDYFRDHFSNSRLARGIFRRSGVERRYGVVDPSEENVSEWGTGERMRRFVEEAVPLGRDALERALDNGGVRREDVGLLAVVSCTGYATPGLDILLAQELGFDTSVQRLHVGHMGCYAALPGLAAAADAVAARGKIAALLAVELTTLHLQPPTDDVGQIVAHALFSDAAAAVAIAPGRPGLEVVDVAARTDADRAGLMTWDVTDAGFRMGLSPEVPAVLERHVERLVDDLLRGNALSRADVSGWAVHPGGPRILDVVAQRLGLSPGDLGTSREILRDYGNCSSATVLLILERMLAEERVPTGGHVVMLAFGPGLTLYGVLLRRRGSSDER